MSNQILTENVGESPIVVIFAAEKGDGLSESKMDPVPAFQDILGLSLSERCVLPFAHLGLKKFIIIVGHEKEMIQAHFEDIAQRRKLSITYVEASDWEKGDGTPIIAASRLLENKPFLLTTVDCLYSSELVREFLRKVAGTSDVSLCVDGTTNADRKIYNDTFVRIDHGAIVEIGETISNGNAIYTGLSSCNPKLFRALLEKQQDDRHSILDVFRRLIERKKVDAIHVSNLAWRTIDNPQTLQEVTQETLAAVGTSSSDGYISRMLNRKISTRISSLLVKTSLTPNQMTLISFSISILGAFLIAMSGRSGAILGALLVQFASIVDGCDGEIARLKQIQTRGGAWLDTLMDRYADIGLTLAITYSVVATEPRTIYWVVGFLSMAGFLLTSYIKKEYEIRFHRPLHNGYLNRLSRRDLRVLGIALGVVIGYPIQGLLTIGVLSHICVLAILILGLNGYGKKKAIKGSVIDKLTIESPLVSPTK